MAIKWNATTKKWVFGSTGAVVATTLLILALCKSCDVQNVADDVKQTAVEAKQDAGAVKVRDAMEVRVDNLTVEFKEHRDSTVAQGVHQAAAKQR